MKWRVKNKMNNKYRCPNCGSENLHCWEEYVMEKHYKLTIDGKPYKRAYKTFDNGAEGHQGIACNDCGEFVNWVHEDATKWHKK